MSCVVAVIVLGGPFIRKALGLNCDLALTIALTARGAGTTPRVIIAPRECGLQSGRLSLEPGRTYTETRWEEASLRP